VGRAWGGGGKGPAEVATRLRRLLIEQCLGRFDPGGCRRRLGNVENAFPMLERSGHSGALEAPGAAVTRRIARGDRASTLADAAGGAEVLRLRRAGLALGGGRCLVRHGDRRDFHLILRTLGRGLGPGSLNCAERLGGHLMQTPYT